MLSELNHSQEIHIVTLEDPIEFFHPHGKAAISQRERGKDFSNFADGIARGFAPGSESHSGR
jgi:twitching motility protein PilT